ncbi:Rpr2-domain-containing protein [Hypoxylon rubiginosum]|uniref:Rpr2-domain-containing protein n=1 Tax=Hypoxylon rubiginosum TaxID=110542 RepID=A0ACC0CTT1_9PEZI|nr:Rpr2-domain-containing protein [Hypoxylon rubiginosum]
MAKSKDPVPNRALHSRISFLYQAAAHFANHSQQTYSNSATKHSENTEAKVIAKSKPASHMSHGDQVLSRRFVTDLRAISHKSQIRMSPVMKRSICKYCDTLLIEGDTSSSVVENNSKGGKKPWADVLVVKCHACQGVKRFPIQTPRQKRRPIREKESKKRNEKACNERQEKGRQNGDVVMGT